MEQQKSPKPKIGNAELADKLAAFDYTKLTGDSWDDYLNLTIGSLANPKKRLESAKNLRSGGLGANDLYDYEGYRCAVLKEELYDGVKDSPVIITGIRLKDTTPEIKTRITAGRAKLMNEQVPNFTMTHPGIYYLLKKAEPQAKQTEGNTANGSGNSNTNSNNTKRN